MALDFSRDFSIKEAVFSPDSKTIAFIDQNNDVFLLSTKNGKETLRLKSLGEVSSIEFNPNGKSVATYHENASQIWSTSNVWSTRKGDRILTLENQQKRLAPKFSPDGKVIAGVSLDNSIKIWNASNGIEIFSFNQAGEDTVIDLVFSNDGRDLALVHEDGTFQLWNINSGEEVIRIKNESVIKSVVFQKDDREIFVVDEYGRVKILKRFHTELADEMCSRISRNFTASEWMNYLDEDLETYELTCAQKPVHPSVLRRAKEYSESGELEESISIYRRAKQLQPDIDLDPSTPELERNPRALARQQASAQQ
jgi:WD40 repeat protein